MIRFFSLLIICSLLFPLKSNAQKNIHDSAQLIELLSDTINLKFPSLSSNFTSLDSSVLISNLNDAIQLSKKLSLKKDEVTLHILRGDFYYIFGLFESSYKDYKQGLFLATEENLEWEKALCLKGLSHTEWRKGNNVSSIEYILASIDLFHDLNDIPEFIKSNNILAGIYVSINKINNADSIYSSMLEQAILHGDSSNMAQCYEYKGVIEFFKEDYRKAINYYSHSLELNNMLHFEIQEGLNNANIAEAKIHLGEYKQAIDHYLKAEKLLIKNHFNSGLIFVYYGLGQSYTQMGELKKGMAMYQKSLAIVDVTGEEREKQQIYPLIVKNYVMQNDYKKAYHNYLLEVAVKDSVDNISKNQQLENIKTRYEVEKKEQHNRSLAQENALKLKAIESQRSIIIIQNIFVGLLFVMLLVLAFLFYKLMQKRKKLKSSNQTKNKLFNIISHDLKGPVGNLKTIAEFLLDEISVSDDPALLTAIKQNKGNIDNAYNLINNLLLWSVSQQEGLKLKREAITLKDIIDESISTFKDLYKNKEIEFLIHVQENLHVLADEHAISSVFRNLISNAIKFTPRGGIIIINAKKLKTTFVEISITDTGVGITPDHMLDLFTIKQMNSSIGTENEIGSGIGLTFCKDIIEKSGGKIWAKSELGVGSAFNFTLPC